MSRRDALTWVVLAAVAVIAVAATADALRREPAPSAGVQPLEESGPLTGEELPEPGVLPGTIIFTSLSGCRPQALSLKTLTLGAQGPSLECELWVSPRADVAVVSLASALGLRGSRVALLDLGRRPRLLEPLGVARGEPSWSTDGERLAWCTARGETVVLLRRTGDVATIEGCRPRITPDGSVLTRPASPLATTLLRDGEVLLDAADLARGFPADGDGPLDLVGYNVRADGLLAVVAVRFESGRRPRRVLQLWRGRALEAVIALPDLGLPAGYGRLGEHVEFAPTGAEVAVAFPGAGKPMVVVDLETRTLAVEPTSQHGFAWSPDGTWLALSTGEEIRILGPGRDKPTYVVPVGAEAIAWR